jgi:hypothetical protein
MISRLFRQLCTICLFRRKDKIIHNCFLLGPIVREHPVAPFNRSVLWVNPDARKVETGTFQAVKDGGGKIKDVELLGRITVAVEDHLKIVQNRIDEILESKREWQFAEVVREVRKYLGSYSPEAGINTLQLDVFSAVVVNRMENKVFIYKKPSSSP